MSSIAADARPTGRQSAWLEKLALQLNENQALVGSADGSESTLNRRRSLVAMFRPDWTRSPGRASRLAPRRTRSPPRWRTTGRPSEPASTSHSADTASRCRVAAPVGCNRRWAQTCAGCGERQADKRQPPPQWIQTRILFTRAPRVSIGINGVTHWRAAWLSGESSASGCGPATWSTLTLTLTFGRTDPGRHPVVPPHARLGDREIPETLKH
jgi:hypothetical protein